MLVSPALRELLDSPEGALLRERLPYKAVGTIGDAGLIGPAELRYVAHVDFLTTDNYDGRGSRYGWSVPEEPFNAFLILLVLVASVVLLLPVLVFIATAVRFGGEQRDRRLAALRLVGADTATTRRIAAGESLAGALIGLAVGIGLFAVARQFAGTVTIWDVNAFPSDVVPMPALAALVLVVVPVASVVVTVFALRGVAIEPLGVVRSAAPRRRRLWWRLLLLAAGAIALQMLFQAMEGAFTHATGEDSARAQLVAETEATTGDEAREMITRFADTRGVDGVSGTITAYAWRPGALKKGEDFAPLTSVKVGGCASLREFAELPSCTDGDVFIALAHGAQGGAPDSRVTETAKPGRTVALRDPEVHKGTLPKWRIPGTARIVDSRPDPTGMYEWGILATPSSIDAARLDDPAALAMVRLDPAVPDAAEYVRNTAAALDRTSWVRTLENTERNAQFASVRTGILVGSTLTMLLVAASLLVTTLEQLRDRKRLLSSLVAFGTRRTTLSWSVLWQTAVPIVLGLVLAVAGGLGLGVVLLKMTGQQVLDWWVFLPATGIGLALIAAVTLLSLPLLWRLMRADGLRTE
ncbi:ABC transporter permease [Streptomyces sp. NPDC057430]|uniref:ABC transporter permease n=1 Tax=unclassified Streptomyces TaxID=2593676 RepID=UPI003674E894